MFAQLLAHLWGDYILQSDWMAQNKTKGDLPALIHAFVYSLLFIPLTWHHGPFCFLAIMWTHFFIDRYRLARYVVWAKNWLAPCVPWIRMSVPGNIFSEPYQQSKHDSLRRVALWIEGPTARPTAYWADCSKTGYPPSTPDWLAVWLLIIADNTLHLTINYAALRWL